VVFIGTSTLQGTLIAGFKDFVTPLLSVNTFGRLLAICCNSKIF
jgi:hypothetical protein